METRPPAPAAIEPMPILLTVKETAARLRISPSKVYSLCDSGALESRYQGVRRFVLAASLTTYVAGLPTEPPARAG